MDVEVERYNLQRLRRLFERRVLAVPEIQREFVWNTKKVCTLLDSIYRGYPIGSALVWKTSSRTKTLLREKLHILPHFDATNREIWFIVDGQQRLSVLYHVLCHDNRDGDAQRRAPVPFDRFFFYTGPADEETELFTYRRGAPPAGYVSVVDILGDRRRRGLRLGTRALRRANECRDRILSASFFLQLMGADDLRDVRETFIRINAQGTPVKSADRAFARASTMQVRQLVRNLTAKLEATGFGDLADEVILSVLAFAFDGSDVGGRAWERLVVRLEKGEIPRTEFDAWWHAIERALPYAIDYLRANYGAAHIGFLPSSQILVLLTLYFAHKGSTRPSRKAAGLLRSWFWLASVSDRYSGRGYRRYLAADAAFMQKLAVRGSARLAIDQLVPLRDLRHAEYSARSSLSRAYFCLLALQRPRYLEDGELVPGDAYASIANRPDRHHIFPRHHLLHHGFGARDFNAIPNVCLLVARENQRIGSKAPRKYLEVGEISHSLRARRTALRSHLIPDGETSGLWETNSRRGFERFMEQRAACIADAFEEQAGMRLFRR